MVQHRFVHVGFVGRVMRTVAGIDEHADIYTTTTGVAGQVIRGNNNTLLRIGGLDMYQNWMRAGW